MQEIIVYQLVEFGYDLIFSICFLNNKLENQTSSSKTKIFVSFKNIISARSSSISKEVEQPKQKTLNPWKCLIQVR